MLSNLTKSGINTTNLHIRDEQSQFAKTGKTVETTRGEISTSITTDSAEQHTGKLAQNFDKARLQKELDLQREVTKNFAPVAAQGVAWASEQLGAVQNYEVLSARKSQVEAALSNTTNPEEREQLQGELSQLTNYLNENQTRYNLWKEGGIGRAALHAAAGGLLTGNVSGAAASGTTSLAAPIIEKLGDTAEAKFGKAGKAVVNATAGLAIGAAVGNGNAGAITAAANTDWNNRQLHPDEMKWIKENAKRFAEEQGIDEKTAEERLIIQAAQEVDYAWKQMINTQDKEALQFLRSASAASYSNGVPLPLGEDPAFFINANGEKQKLFSAIKDEYYSTGKYSGLATQYDKANNQVLTNALIPEIRNNLIVKSGSDVLDGLSSSGRALLNHPPETAKTLTQNMVYSASECVKSPFRCIGEKWSTLTSASKDILRTHYNQSDVNYLYGKDMSVETTLIPSIRGGSVVAEFAPVAKAGSAAVKGASILGQKATVAASEKITRGGSLSYVTGNELGNNYRILSLGIVEGPNGGKLINTGVKDAVTNSTIYQRISPNGTLSNRFLMIDDNGLQINVSKPLGLKNTLSQEAPIHHICTDKNCISTANGGPWTPKFEKIFDGANLNFNDIDNKVKVVGHQGPHPEKYHKIVYDRLYDATRGLSPKSTQYEEAVRSKLKQLKIEISDSNTELNKLVIGVDK